MDPLVPNQVRYQTAPHSDKTKIIARTRWPQRPPLNYLPRPWPAGPNSAFLVLRVPEQDVACRVVCDRAAQLGQDLDAALHGRPGSDQVKPFFQVGVIGPGDAVVLPVAQPRENRDVGDGVLVAGDKLAGGQLLVHDAVETPGFVGVAVYRVLDLFGRVLAEVVGLSDHRPDAAHLEHQPLQHLEFQPVRLGQKLACLGSQVQQDGAGLEQGDRLSVRSFAVHQRRNLVVRADGQELRLELVAGADVDGHGLPVASQLKAAFLQHDVDLVAVGRGP